MNSHSDENMANIFEIKSPLKSTEPRVRLTFQTCDFIETKKSGVISKGITPLLYSFDLQLINSSTPISRMQRNHNFSPFLGSLTKRNAASPLSPSTWQKLNSSVKKPKYYDTPIDCGLSQKTDKKLPEGLLHLNDLDFAPLPATHVFKKPYLNFEKYETENQFRSNTKTIMSYDAMAHRKLSISKTSIIDKKDDVKDEKNGCNCRNSKCLKLYCECLRKGGFCNSSCNCFDCENHALSDIRRDKVKNIERKNPSAFKPIIKSQNETSAAKMHSKGCNCRKSNCLKNYCECHQFGVKCGEHCRCVSCKNTEDIGTNKNIENFSTRDELYNVEMRLSSISFD